jgi:beta-phosphoglucomutase-like phosphatase (HAD superfamily)
MYYWGFIMKYECLPVFSRIGHAMPSMCIAILLLFSDTVFCVNVIFDIGDTLFTTSKKEITKLIWPEALAYSLTFHNPAHAKKILFEIFNRIEPIKNPELHVEDGEGNVVPQIMRDWLCGLIPGKQALSLVDDFCDKNPGMFSNKAERDLIRAIASIIFTPKLFIQTQELIPQALAFVQYCKRNGHRLYVLSNWDGASFDLFKKEYPALFGLFDGIIISGRVGTLKPDKALYEKFLATFNLDPKQSIYIDDQKKNLEVAASLGFHPILCKKSNPPFYAPWLGKIDYDSICSSFEQIIKKIPHTSPSH